MKKLLHQLSINQQETDNYTNFNNCILHDEVLELVPLPCLILNKDFKILKYNKEVPKLLVKEDIHLKYVDFLHILHLKETENEQIKNELKNLILDEVSIFYFQFNETEKKFKVLLKKGKIGDDLIYFVNIYEQKADTNLVKDQELNCILKSSLTATWIINLDDFSFKIHNFSKNLFKSIETAFFYLIEDFTRYIYQDDRDTVQIAIVEAVKNRKDLDIEFRIINQQNYPVYLSMRGHLIKKENQQYYLAGFLIDITEKKSLQKQAENLRLNQQRVVLDAIYRAQEKERKKISEVLHDSVSQLLYGIRLNIQSLQLSGHKNEEFKNINQLIDQAVKETRAIAYELKPSILIDFGFSIGIKELAERLSTTNFSIKAYINTLSDQLHPEIQLSLFRIIQELINNCIKHAKATSAEIIVFTDKEKIDLIVHDNGKGFDTKHPETLKGSGIKDIKSKVFLLNGELNIQSRKGKGTHIAIKFMIEDAVAALSII
ncbi:PAS domain-containing sensor histidine kinase [Pedobacter glucosidilyticus]|uniref:sensor histidine kinase n=1 Tax=Pedobacter glucosidilyticus TaxID=1122941 RepID=UPI000479E81E|nr:PAS domain-containing sensor histidine kinase [Pedobacter glucosidilyticus]